MDRNACKGMARWPRRRSAVYCGRRYSIPYALLQCGVDVKMKEIFIRFLALIISFAIIAGLATLLGGFFYALWEM